MKAKFAIVFMMFSLACFARSSLSDKNKEQLQEVFKAHDGLHASFYNYDGKKVEAAAKVVAEKMAGIEDGGIARTFVYAIRKLKEMKEESKESENKQAYTAVSIALVRTLKKFDIGEHWNVYSCPMNKKQWVQDSQKLEKGHNPYDPSMGDCARKETSY